MALATLQEAVAVADAGLAVEPNSIGLRTVKAHALVAQGRAREAVSALSGVWTFSVTPRAGLVLAEALMQSGDERRAESVLRAVEQRFPDAETAAEIDAVRERPCRRPHSRTARTIAPALTHPSCSRTLSRPRHGSEPG